jgi:hypothetical protein
MTEHLAWMEEIHEAAILEKLHGARAHHVEVPGALTRLLPDLRAGGEELDLHPLEYARDRGIILRVEGGEASHETPDVHRGEYRCGVPDAQSRTPARRPASTWTEPALLQGF